MKALIENSFLDENSFRIRKFFLRIFFKHIFLQWLAKKDEGSAGHSQKSATSDDPQKVPSQKVPFLCQIFKYRKIYLSWYKLQISMLIINKYV